MSGYALIRAAAFWSVLQVCCVLGIAGNTNDASLQGKLQQRVARYAVTASNFPDALVRVAGQFEIPMGIVWVRSPATNAPIDLSWKDATVQQILSTIAKTQTGYAISIERGVVHIFPLDAIPDRQNFLRLPIKTFDVQDQFVEVAQHQLRRLVAQTVSPQKPPTPNEEHQLGGVAGTVAVTIEYPKVSLRFENTTVEDILDAVATVSPRKLWIVTFESDSTLTPGGFRRTETLWNNSALPDDLEPVWDMFRWGDAIPSAVLGKN
jgi:hypothetical protein